MQEQYINCYQQPAKPKNGKYVAASSSGYYNRGVKEERGIEMRRPDKKMHTTPLEMPPKK